MAIRGAKLTFDGGGKFLGVRKLQGTQQACKKNQKKVVTVKVLYFIGAPFEFNGRAQFKLVTPLKKGRETPRAYPGGERRGRPLPLGKFDAPQGYQNNDFHLKIRAIFSLMSSEKCHITIFARPPP